MARARVVSPRRVVSSRRVVSALVTVIACAMAVGCTAPKAPATPSAEPSSAATRESAEDEPFPVGAMEQFLADLSAVGIESPAVRQERMAAHEAVLATCMQEQGFDYVPVDWSYIEELTPGPPPPPTDIDDAALEFAAEFGYGVSTQGELSAGTSAGGFVDPNAEYVAAMSPAEQEAYYLALMGPGQGEDYITGIEPFDWTKHGCGGLAGHETGDGADTPSFFTDAPTSFDETPYEALRAEIDAMWVTIEEDPRIVAAGQSWSSCMADAGYPGFTSVSSAQAAFFDEEMRIIEETFGALSGDPSDAYSTSQEYLAAEKAAAQMRSQLVERERATAVADLECQAEVRYPRLYAEVSAELQQAFYDGHRTDLEAWLAAAAEYYAQQ